MRTRRTFVRECGRATRCALLPGLVVLTIAMGLVVVTPPLAGGAQTEHFTVELFWTTGCPGSSSAPVEVLSAFSYSPTGSSSTSGLGSVPKGVTATMPVNAESVSVMLQDVLTDRVEPKVCVAFYSAATTVTTKPVFYYQFTNALITSYVLQDEVGTGASVQTTFSYQKVVIAYLSAGSTTPILPGA